MNIYVLVKMIKSNIKKRKKEDKRKVRCAFWEGYFLKDFLEKVVGK